MNKGNVQPSIGTPTTTQINEVQRVMGIDKHIGPTQIAVTEHPVLYRLRFVQVSDKTRASRNTLYVVGAKIAGQILRKKRSLPRLKL